MGGGRGRGCALAYVLLLASLGGSWFREQDRRPNRPGDHPDAPAQKKQIWAGRGPGWRPIDTTSFTHLPAPPELQR